MECARTGHMRAMVLYGWGGSDISVCPCVTRLIAFALNPSSGGFSMPSRNFENRTLYHGDNLDFLRG